MRSYKFSSCFLPLLIFAYSVFAGFIIYRAASFVFDKHFSLLSASFIKNDLFLSPYNLPDGDYVDFNAKQYLYFGPMPSILLIPFVLVWGKNFPQMTLSIGSLVIIFFSIFLLLKKFKFQIWDRLWLANFFVFGTVLYFVGLVDISAYLVQAVGTAFVVLSLLEYFTKRRWFLIGMLIAAAGATRITLFGMATFYIIEIFRIQRLNFRRPLIYFMIPIIFCVLFLGLYNFRRFHSFFDTGYTRNITTLINERANHKLGFFSIVHVPANLYSLLVMTPEPVKRENVEFVLKFPYLKANGTGMAIWFTSPLFIYLLLAKKGPYTFSAIAGILILLLPSLFYFGIGTSQFGYRYSLDFLPLLFLILLSAFEKGLPRFAKLLIFLGIIFNTIYMLSIWNSYPLFSFWKYLD